MKSNFFEAWKGLGIFHRSLFIFNLLVLVAMVSAWAGALATEQVYEQEASPTSCSNYCLKADAPVLVFPYADAKVQDRLPAGSEVWPTLKRVDYWNTNEYALVEYAPGGDLKTGYILRSSVDVCQ